VSYLEGSRATLAATASNIDVNAETLVITFTMLGFKTFAASKSVSTPRWSEFLRS
jgi:hypothetical protein